MLTDEETFLWNCARSWREPTALNIPAALDWARVVAVGKNNRMQTLLADPFATVGVLSLLPDETRCEVQNAAAKMEQNAAMLGDYLRDYLQRAAGQGLETIVLKGLSVSINVYGNAAMRPGGDIDILVRSKDVERSLAIQQEMGVGAYWPNLMDDRYYALHHLHQQRCTPDLKVWFETHWALDHPLTTLTIDYDAILERATPGTLLGETVSELSLPDLILSLALHLVKHATYLPSVIERADLARIILADGMLMYYMDVAEVIKQHGKELNWSLVVELAQQWGAVDIIGSVLRVCSRYLESPVPRWVLDALPVRGPGAMTRWAMNRVADHLVATHMGEPPNRLWDLILVTNGAFVLRPVRLLEVASYCFPGPDYLQRRYGRNSYWMAAFHLMRAVGQYARAAVDTLVFTVERHRRLKALHQNSSLFNRLD